MEAPKVRRPAWLSTMSRMPSDPEGHGPHDLSDPSWAFKFALGAAWRGGATFERGTDHLAKALTVAAELVAAELIHPSQETLTGTGQPDVAA